MSKRFFCLFLSLVMLLGILSGCTDTSARPDAPDGKPEATEATTEPTVPATVPADGDPDDVTCKGSYTVEDLDGEFVARVADKELTNATLQVFYQLEAAGWSGEEGPDFTCPLDTQACPIDDSVNSWQQFFLKRALNAWHTAQALEIQSQEMGIPTEPDYQPNLERHEEYMTDKPATKWLYGYNKSYFPNEKHQAYLDALPAVLDALAKERGFADGSALAQEGFGITRTELEEAVTLYNFAYMYFTSLGYDLEAAAEEVEVYSAEGFTRDSAATVNFRHILLSQDAAVTSETLLQQYAKELKDNSYNILKTTEEAIFAELANEYSQDEGTRNDGGAYRDIPKGQLPSALESWCFDAERKYGDVTTVETEQGTHILFYSSGRDAWQEDAEAAIVSEKQTGLIAAAREAYPMDVNYSGLQLLEVDFDAAVSAEDILYPDVAHERFPVIPLYLQQDYPNTKYGAYKITSHGCGITTMAMLASYMADDDYTPPRMCGLYPNYVYKTGTDGRLFVTAPAELGFYLRQRTFDWRDAYAALEEGYIVVSVQQKGFWTRGGHYLVIEKLLEDGRILVRDSNLFNYGRLHDHKIDSFEWHTITPNGQGYWIYEKKVVTIPACSRCGEGNSPILQQEYLCHKCNTALIRRNTWLDAVGT